VKERLGELPADDLVLGRDDLPTVPVEPELPAHDHPFPLLEELLEIRLVEEHEVHDPRLVADGDGENRLPAASPSERHGKDGRDEGRARAGGNLPDGDERASVVVGARKM